MFYKPLINLGSSQISKNDWRAIWNYYHSNKNILLKRTNQVTKIAHSYYDQACVNYVMERLLSFHLHCSTNIVKVFYNFSEFTNRDMILSPAEDYSDYFLIKQRLLHMAPLASGNQFNGFRFSIFAKPNQKSVGNALVALLTPFSYFDWAFVATTIFLLAATLKLTGFGICNALFWVVVSILEQGEFRREHVVNKNKHLIIGWLLIAFLLPRIYTLIWHRNRQQKVCQNHSKN